MAGSTGVLGECSRVTLPNLASPRHTCPSSAASVPPVGYLQRIREICTQHDILLIFDEVITGFGRIGSSFATSDPSIIQIAMAKERSNALRCAEWSSAWCRT